MNDLPCTKCWEEKQKKGGDIFDVVTKHFVDAIKKTAKCSVCGDIQDVEIIE